MDLADFSSMMKKVSDEDKARADNAKFKVEDKGYKIIPFMSYEDLHDKFGGDKTGYDGESEWCHTNGRSTYDSWTENYTKFFFVIAKDNWEEIAPHDNPRRNDNAYDEYGLSLMAILVSRKGKLLNCTLRWNHVVEPKYAKPGREVDRAYISYAELSQATGLDVEAEVKKELAKILERFKTIPKGKKVYEGPEGLCFARDHLYWYDKDFNEIDPPDEINGSIDCYNTKITSLEGSPEKVGGFFYCRHTNITSFKGGPKTVIGYFDCSYTKITSLEGSPREVGGNFNCSGTNITSLEGSPRIVGRSFNCSDTKITSLEGSPKKVGGYFDCSNTNITSLKGCPEKVGSSFDCSNTEITSLKGAPKIIDGDFDCSYTNIASLEGSPEKVGGNFWCINTEITSLKGAPKSVGENFNCSQTDITSLEGCPKEVGNELICSRTNIASLKGAPAKIGDINYYSNFPNSISA